MNKYWKKALLALTVCACLPLTYFGLKSAMPVEAQTVSPVAETESKLLHSPAINPYSSHVQVLKTAEAYAYGYDYERKLPTENIRSALSLVLDPNLKEVHKTADGSFAFSYNNTPSWLELTGGVFSTDALEVRPSSKGNYQLTLGNKPLVQAENAKVDPRLLSDGLESVRQIQDGLYLVQYKETAAQQETGEKSKFFYLVAKGEPNPQPAYEGSSLSADDHRTVEFELEGKQYKGELRKTYWYATQNGEFYFVFAGWLTGNLS